MEMEGSVELAETEEQVGLEAMVARVQESRRTKISQLLEALQNLESPSQWLHPNLECTSNRCQHFHQLRCYLL